MKNLKHLTLVSALIAAVGLDAQESYGTIVGTVRGPNGNPVAGATITIRGSQLLGDRPAQTDAQGNYRLPLLQPGQYTLTASAQGFVMSNRASVNIAGGSTIRVDLSLRSMAAQEETVEVVATENPVIDKTETKVASTYLADELKSLPTGQTGIYAAAFLAPGVQQMGTGYDRMRGGMAGSPQYLLNGMVTKDNSAGQGRQYEMVIEDLLQDVQVIQNPINAKYGFSQSGLISSTTKTGTNEFQGSFRLILSNAAWRTYNGGPVWNRFNEMTENVATNAPYMTTYAYNNETWGFSGMQGNPSNDHLNKNYEITVSGPIIKDRLTFTYGARIIPSTPSSGNRYNPLQANADNNYTYLPRLTFNDPRYTGPIPTGLPGAGTQAENWAGYRWGANPLAPTTAMPHVVKGANNVYSYKLFWQISNNHQLEYNYTTNPYTSGYDGNNISTWVADPGEELPVQQGSNRINRSMSYKGIIGNSGVLSASYGDTYSNIYWAYGPEDPVYVTMWSSGTSGALLTNRTSVTRPVAYGQTGNFEIRGNTTYNLDYNHIWENHNFDIGVQMLEENLTVQPSAFGRFFNVPGRYYDGRYVVFSTHPEAGGPLYTGNGVAIEGTPFNGGNINTHRTFLFNNLLVPSYRNFNLYGASDIAVKGTTTSFYLNDNWTLNDNLAINLGLRVDNNKFDDASGERANATTISPRIRIQYDLLGDNKHVFALSAVQRNGTFSPGQIGRNYAISGDSQTRTYFWNQTNPNPSEQPWQDYLVDKEDIMNPANYGYYYRYADAAQSWFIDSGLKPQLTTEFELNYRRAFDQGGYFRVALVYNYLSNAMMSTLVDEQLEITDQSGSTPSAGNTYDYTRILKNDSTRGRHYASAEMEWMVPIINQATYKLNWHGNWTVAKTTGNSIFSYFFGSTAMGETNTTRFFEYAEAVGMPMEYLDPWGELNTPRHSMRTWFAFTHGVRGGIVNEVNLLATYDLGVPNIFNHTYILPTNTFYYSRNNPNAGTNGGLVTTYPTTVTLHPYGRGYRRDVDVYYVDLQWNATIPIKGRLSLFFNTSIGNVFNSIYVANVSTAWTDGTTNPNWVAGSSPADYPMWGKNMAVRNSGHAWGTNSSLVGARQFNVRFDTGFRF